jgi:hypothetical protein
LEDLDDKVDISRALETIRENIKTSETKLLWFDEKFPNVNSIRREASRHFRNKKRKYIKKL